MWKGYMRASCRTFHTELWATPISVATARVHAEGSSANFSKKHSSISGERTLCVSLLFLLEIAWNRLVRYLLLTLAKFEWYYTLEISPGTIFGLRVHSHLTVNYTHICQFLLCVIRHGLHKVVSNDVITLIIRSIEDVMLYLGRLPTADRLIKINLNEQFSCNCRLLTFTGNFQTFAYFCKLNWTVQLMVSLILMFSIVESSIWTLNFNLF